MSSSNSIHTPPVGLGTNPFATPLRLSRAPTEDERRGTYFPAAVLDGSHQPRLRKFKSARWTGGEYEKPWTTEKNPKKKWEKIIFWGSIVVGFAIGGLICFFAYASVTNHEYCLLLEDNFKTIDPNTWNYEIQRGGFGSGTFEWTTDDPKNAYTDENGLHIVPTLTTETTSITVDQIYDGYVLNLTTDGTCTSTDVTMCSIRSNRTAGTIINPVRSARINTKGKKSITYGKVEVVAKMPKGDWLWPAIWMMPEKNTYGPWPASGEIDIAESRGNYGDDYPSGGRDALISALHWGPVPEADAFYKTSGQHMLRRTDWTESFHTFGVEWSEKYLFTYIDSRLLQVFFVKFTNKKNMWARGNFGSSILNHSALFDPWSQTGRANTPFDEPFYLILNVAVGSTNGFFPDGVGNKPWGDKSDNAPKAFWDSQSQWYPSWGAGDTKGLTVKSVKMWKEGAC
ncbi:glycoside hydrolase family 16 protein [Lepidopterella palustris CBS 459.81]|uniref:Glycoside hydrolase family 16 protein n=1 Tax=Lepidopterella palustris CBS 459.81 TaxID=1314670 RepID=A0A8E2E5L7_9PEZI|nr:glycoside hydrolase family 16 protein [Lepidopterella palustris CBS 459.81]